MGGKPSLWQAFLWYLVSVLLAVRGVTQLGSEHWAITAAWLLGALFAVGMAAWRTPLYPGDGEQPRTRPVEQATPASPEQTAERRRVGQVQSDAETGGRGERGRTAAGRKRTNVQETEQSGKSHGG